MRPDGRELWQSDGTAAGTALVKDINPGTYSPGPSYLTAVGGTLFFTAFDYDHGRELWRTGLTDDVPVLADSQSDGRC